ncbi:double-strand break repair protein AddB [Maritimibacter sp. DP1N21-5]|uniref:double-strand break repair protein AddB n=1 Tax=Maritimibacter sp. DP1N21-5 TaxID=2836867 RepID=UPI001C491D65|nr:double-strand break repair protein AddB [Maritimibacter sp. DP1N21-5]MBV7410984.1 double-strand break repair protein AddB [Maritimibacter sp. DP1N21-5]
MFDPSDLPRLFAQAPGCDFPQAIVDGLRARLAGAPPEAMARVTLYVNTQRMRRRITELFAQGPAGLLPKIRLVTDLGTDAAFADIPPAVSPLRRRLELAELIAQLLDSQPDLAPKHASFSLAESLAALLDEMQGEGVAIEALRRLDVSNHSRYWARSLAFLDLAERFLGAESGEPPDAEGRQRRVIERLVRDWETDPPRDPVLLVGSTGSRGATSVFMQAVARLPQGAVVLPGFDFDLPEDVWDKADNALTAEDHPQFRFRRLLTSLGLPWSHVRPWHDMEPPVPERNALVSLALRPAPVTDSWQKEGPAFRGIDEATRNLTLLEATSPRQEATAIALVLRDAAERGEPAALISPDRTLTRQVTAALDRWRIVPDDSAGRPLPLTAPGRLLRHVADLRGRKITGVELLTLLKHPLTHSGEGRGEHLRLTRDLELKALRRDMPFPDAKTLADWAESDLGRIKWTDWIAMVLSLLADVGDRPLLDHVDATVRIAELLAAGSAADGSGGLWEKEPGRVARSTLDELRLQAPYGGTMNAVEFRDLFTGVLNGREVREARESHPGIMIWGTLEARVQGVGLVILAGLNDGTWPEAPSPDPWMNRAMRHAAGLLLPERRIGLSAHDFQQAIGAKKVLLTRSVRSDDSETVPSRWINRLSNLMQGMSPEGRDALTQMRARGQIWLDRVDDLDAPERVVPRATRPAPKPPVHVRPNRLSFTQIGKMVRDPYAIYAQKILRLHALDPLHRTPDAPLKGTILHKVFERFIRETPADEMPEHARERLLETAKAVFEQNVPWPAARLLWLAKLERNVDWFLEGERQRQSQAAETLTEQRGEASFFDPPFTLYGFADRIDVLNDGRVALYDYKTGQIPTKDQQLAYDKQLLLEALVAHAGGFATLGSAETARVAYIGLGATAKIAEVEADAATLARIESEFDALIASFRTRERGYVSRRVMFSANDRDGTYDHLARYGEWGHTDSASPEEVGE